MNPMKITALLSLLVASLASADDYICNLDNTSGAAPKGWTAGVTGKGAARWTVEKDPAAATKPNVLKQSGVADYAVLLKDYPTLKDGFVEVKGKALSGKEDQAIGVLFRAKDANNYYVCRANALEDNIVFYKAVNGKRSPLDIVGRTGGYGVAAKVPPQQWHTLRVEFAGDTFKVIWNSKEIFQVKDSTFTEAGKTGLWTKADSVTAFDTFTCGDRSPKAAKERAEAKPYPLKWCLCTGDRLDDPSSEDVISFIHASQEFRVCCHTCQADFFDKEPAKYVKLLAEAVAAGATEKQKK